MEGIKDFSNLKMVNRSDNSMILRISMFTQSLYFLAGVLTFSFVRYFYRRKWDSHIFTGIIFFALFGIYEWLFFLVFGYSGDFLSNRVYDDYTFVNPGFVTLQLGSYTFSRFKSFTSEASMYAFTALPFWIYAIHTKRSVTQALLLVTLLLSTATTAVLGILVYMIGYIKYLRVNYKYLTKIILILILFYGVFYQEIGDFIDTMVFDKIMLEHISGKIRFALVIEHLSFFIDAPLFHQLFGIGFGYIRSADMFTTLLVNSGILGVGLTTVAFFYPVWKLPNNYRNIGIKLSLIVIYITMMISVPEYAFLSVWLFLGIAYNEIDITKTQVNITTK
jgi:hypothetical protein